MKIIVEIIHYKSYISTATCAFAESWRNPDIIRCFSVDRMQQLQLKLSYQV